MIEPVMVNVIIGPDPDRAFDLFTRRIADWWPLETHSLGASDNQKTPEAVVMEPFTGGRIFEISQEGVEKLWGSVTEWDPGRHVAFTWHVGRVPENGTRVSVQFQQADAGGTLITLTHDNWHVLGAEAQEQRNGYAEGWVALLNDQFLTYTANNP
jgi:uncharacterized protein YndB with AHSA1/START domain